MLGFEPAPDGGTGELSREGHDQNQTGDGIEANGLELAVQCDHGSPESADCQGIIDPLVRHPVDGAALPAIQQGCPLDNGEQIHVNRAWLVGDPCAVCRVSPSSSGSLATACLIDCCCSSVSGTPSVPT